MSKHMTIINLACTITKVRKWGEGWKHSAESAHAAFAELHMKHKEAERTIETLRANLTQTESECQAELAVVKDERDQLRVERDALRAQLDTERQKVREWIAENKRLQTETAERGVEIASLQVRLRQSIARGETAAVPQSVDVPRTLRTRLTRKGPPDQYGTKNDDVAGTQSGN